MNPRLDAMDYQRIIEDAMEKGDQKTLAIYEPFANKVTSLGAWGMALNYCEYHCALACGFKVDYESHLNEYGWFDFKIKPSEVVTVWKPEKRRKKEIEGAALQRVASIELAHLPNGKWISALWCIFSRSGHGDSITTFSKQFSTRQEALRDKLKDIVYYTDGEPESVVNAVKRGITELWGSDEKREPVQLELF